MITKIVECCALFSWMLRSGQHATTKCEIYSSKVTCYPDCFHFESFTIRSCMSPWLRSFVTSLKEITKMVGWQDAIIAMRVFYGGIRGFRGLPVVARV
jgi:hypothetical protein